MKKEKKKKVQILVISVIILLLSGFLGLNSTVSSSIRQMVKGASSVSESSIAETDMYCLPSPTSTVEESVTVIKVGETLTFTGNKDGNYVEIVSPRYVPTCWILVR